MVPLAGNSPVRLGGVARCSRDGDVWQFNQHLPTAANNLAVGRFRFCAHLVAHSLLLCSFRKQTGSIPEAQPEARQSEKVCLAQ
jgi:hypothetical protein